jgi:hypothetical protein
MSQSEILEEIKKLKSPERLAVLQEALKLIGDDFKRNAGESSYLPLAEAAKLMKAEYEAGGELTAFSVLDGEDIYEER